MARLSRILAISTQVKHVVLLSSAHVHINRICQVPVLLVSGWLERDTGCLRRHKHPCGLNKQGLYKVAFPLERREGKKEERNGMEGEGKGKARQEGKGK